MYQQYETDTFIWHLQARNVNFPTLSVGGVSCTIYLHNENYFFDLCIQCYNQEHTGISTS